jgi:hypothetical protein
VTPSRETMHVLGIEKEAEAERLAIRLTSFTAVEPGLSDHDAERLGHLAGEDERPRGCRAPSTRRTAATTAPLTSVPGRSSPPRYLLARSQDR